MLEYLTISTYSISIILRYLHGADTVVRMKDGRIMDKVTTTATLSGGFYINLNNEDV